MKFICENPEFGDSQMFEKNLGLLKSIVSKFVKHQIEDSDLYSIGCMALLKAIRTFDPSKSSFSTWATRIIRNSIITQLRKNKKDQVIVFSSIEEKEKDEKLIDQQKEEVPFKLIKDLIKIDNSDSKTEAENKKILIDHYLEGKSLSEIGKQFGITKERVRQRAKEGIAKIRIKNKKILKEFVDF